MTATDREFTISLGSPAEDEITGFSGTVTGRAEYLTGCRQYLVTPRCDDPSKLNEAHWFDEDRLKVHTLAPETGSPPKGGPVARAPIRRAG